MCNDHVHYLESESAEFSMDEGEREGGIRTYTIA